MVVFVLFFCCTLFGPSRRRKRFTQVIGVQDGPSENNLDESARINESFVDDQNQDGVILRVFPDYGEVQVQKYNYYVQFLCK